MNDPAQNPYLPTSNPGNVFNQTPGGAATVGAAARIGMIITFALISGVVTITAVMLVLSLPADGQWQALMRFGGEDFLFFAVGAALCAGGVMAAVVMRRVMLQRSLSQLNASDEPLPQPIRDDSDLPASGQTFLGGVAMATLLGQALMEGPAVVNAILMLLSGNFAHLILIAVSTIGIVSLTPTPGRLRALMEQAR